MRFLRTTPMLIAGPSALALAPLSTTLAQEGTPAAMYSCAAENADPAFIDQTIPHHRMAIEASEVVLDQATHPEMREFAPAPSPS